MQLFLVSDRMIPKYIWDGNINLDIAEAENYIFDINGTVISKLCPDTLWGSGISLRTGNFSMQMIITNNCNAVRFWWVLSNHWSDWKPI